MATSADFKAVRELAPKLTFGQWQTLLDEMMADPDVQGVRHWLAGGHDPKQTDLDKQPRALITTAEAGDLLDVERQRIWRWEKQGKLIRVATTNSGPLFSRLDVLRVGAEEEERGGRRSRGSAAEEPAEA